MFGRKCSSFVGTSWDHPGGGLAPHLLLLCSVLLLAPAHAQARSSHRPSAQELRILADTSPPTVPTNLAASQITSTSVTLVWSASSDDVGVTGYEILRDKVLVGTSKVLTYTSSGLQPGVLYTFTVRAFDTAGNRSRNSSPLRVRTLKFSAPDREAPTTPTGLQSPQQTRTSIGLSWNASSDNVGVTGYDILLSGQPVGTSSSPAFLVEGLAENAPYTFTVRSFDAAGNKSGESASLSVDTLAPPPDPEPGDGKVAAYFVSWGVYGRNYHVKNLVTSDSARKLTHVTYAFANVVNGRCELGDAYADIDRYYSASESVDGQADSWDSGALRGSFHQLQKLKALVPELRVLIAVGGWTWSSGFTEAAATSASRQTFAASCIALFLTDPRWTGVFDGIDIDWEYPGSCGDSCSPPQDASNYTLLLQELRRQLDALDPDLELTTALPLGPEHYGVLELADVADTVDAIGLMAYDAHGAWDSLTNHHAPLTPSPADPSQGLGYTIEEAVGDYLAAGVPAEKLLLGVPFYGRGWSGVGSTGNGLYQPATGAAPGTWEAGIEDYKVLKGLELTYGSFWDSVAEASWLYSSSSRIFWSYDSAASVANKAEYARTLGGTMGWELSGDDSSGTLVDTLWRSR